MEESAPPFSFSPPAEVFATRRFGVMQTRVSPPAGASFDYTFIVPRNGVVVLPVLDDGRLLLIRNRRLPVGQTLWELPAGVVEAGEDPAAAAARELAEETGHRAAQLAPLPGLFTSPGISTEKQSVFAATGLTPVAQRLEAGEEIGIHPLPVAQVLAMARRGEIQDARCLAVVLWWASFGV